MEALSGTLLQLELKENPKPGPECLRKRLWTIAKAISVECWGQKPGLGWWGVKEGWGSRDSKDLFFRKFAVKLMERCRARVEQAGGFIYLLTVNKIVQIAGGQEMTEREGQKEEETWSPCYLQQLKIMK